MKMLVRKGRIKNRDYRSHTGVDILNRVAGSHGKEYWVDGLLRPREWRFGNGMGRAKSQETRMRKRYV